MLVHWIWLAHRPGVSDRAKVELLQHFCDPERIYLADEESLRCVEDLTRESMEGLRDKDLSESEKILDRCAMHRLHIVTYQDAAYPARLRTLADPPMVLYYRGNLPDFEARPYIGVVGTRRASAYGLMSAKRLGYQISCCGGIVVSGMAEGIDGMAMAGALSGGQPVVGVLGCGADVVYPRSNRALFEDTERYGCILSEFPPGFQPTRWSFPKRNRIISGISNGVLVVEAPERSGALITAREALEQGRDVFAIPGDIGKESCVGSNRLLRDGAILISTGWDVLSEYECLFPEKLHRADMGERQTVYADELAKAKPGLLPKVAEQMARPEPKKEPKTKSKSEKPKNLNKKLDKKPIDKGAAGPYIDISAKLNGLNEDERLIVAALQQGPRLADDVVAETGLSTGRLLATMTMLELKGILRRLPGKRLSLRSNE